MDSTAEATVTTVAAVLVLLSAMCNPVVLAVIAVTILAALEIYKLAPRNQ